MSVHGFINDEFVVDDSVTLINRLDISNSLHLHPNDYAALTVVSVKLKRTKNYQVWSFIMLLALEAASTAIVFAVCQANDHGFGGLGGFSALGDFDVFLGDFERFEHIHMNIPMSNVEKGIQSEFTDLRVLKNAV
ncbi:hypothetical protein Tco_0683815 [Tanacetum coccineum]